MQSAAILAKAPSSTVRIVRTDALSISLILFFLCFWHWRITGSLNIQALAALGLFVALCLAYGRLFVMATSRLFSPSLGLPYQVLTGYFVFNSLLFILALASPFGMAVNLVVLSLIGGAGYFIKQRSPAVSKAPPANRRAAMAAVLIAGIGATIWCGDAQTPIRLQDSDVLFKVWPDTFIHAREISVFAQAHGIGTIQDIKLAGGKAPIYHFASYLSPSAISVMSGASAMDVYASFHLPVGIMFTGLAAYCLMSLMFGSWAGVAAAVALLLLPDGYHQGFGARYLSHNFLAQVNLGLLYGITCAALAWIFVIQGCRKGKIGLIALGYVFLVVCLFYKAHIFVANSYLLMMFPILFFQPLRTRWRILIGIAATAVFVAVVMISQTNPRVPILRLDGSGIGRYIVVLLWDFEAGALKTFFNRVFIEEKNGKLLQLVYAMGMLLLCTFGLWVLGLCATLAGARKKIEPLFLWFPILVVANYLIMGIGLAVDSRGVGTPDELLNRPLVWAYFVVATWTAAAAYYLLIGTEAPRANVVKGALLAGVLAAIGITVYQAPNLQTFPERHTRANYEKWAVPSCLVQSAQYLRAHSTPSDIVQDSTNDPDFVFTALAERQLYVGKVSFGGENAVQMARLEEMKQFKNMQDVRSLEQFASASGIKWYLLAPGANVSWPAEFVQRPAFSCGAYRLYRFAPRT